MFSVVAPVFSMPPGWGEWAEEVFGRTAGMMKFFQDYIAEPYAWGRYSQTTVWDFLWGGMENTGATTLNMRAIHDERAHLDYSADYLIAHELVHQWFGGACNSRDRHRPRQVARDLSDLGDRGAVRRGPAAD